MGTVGIVPLENPTVLPAILASSLVQPQVPGDQTPPILYGISYPTMNIQQRGMWVSPQTLGLFNWQFFSNYKHRTCLPWKNGKHRKSQRRKTKPFVGFSHRELSVQLYPLQVFCDLKIWIISTYSCLSYSLYFRLQNERFPQV